MAGGFQDGDDGFGVLNAAVLDHRYHFIEGHWCDFDLFVGVLGQGRGGEAGGEKEGHLLIAHTGGGPDTAEGGKGFGPISDLLLKLSLSAV